MGRIRIEALAADRAALWDRVSAAPFLTRNEKREAVGYGPVEGGDKWR
jgi:phage portal protein BeeE